MNFLIIVYKGIGDVILTTPLVKAVKRFFRDSKVFFLTKKYSSEVLRDNPLIDDLLIREELKLSYLRGLNIDVSFDFMLSSSSAFYSVISGAKKRVAFWRSWGFLSYTHMIKSSWHTYNAMKRFEYLTPFGIDPKKIEDITPVMYLSERDRDHALEMLKEKGVRYGDLIATFDITSPRLERQPSADNFIYSADNLVRMGFKTIFAPAPWERNYVLDSIRRYSLYPNRHIVLENLSIRMLGCVISFSDIHIGTSSSPMHMAVSFDVPTFTLYSKATDPISWTPPMPIHGYIQLDLKDYRKEYVWTELKKHMDKLVFKKSDGSSLHSGGLDAKRQV